jgi:hypothetical protein
MALVALLVFVFEILALFGRLNLVKPLVVALAHRPLTPFAVDVPVRLSAVHTPTADRVTDQHRLHRIWNSQ